MWRSLTVMMGLWGGLALGVPVDVPAGHWARQALERVMQLGLLTGYPDGLFRGEQALTRYQAAVLLLPAPPVAGRSRGWQRGARAATALRGALWWWRPCP